MFKQFIACAPENYLKGRKNQRPEAIVVHGLTSFERAEELYQNPSSSLSAHYVVDAQGTAHQYVEEADSAFHAGVVVNPTWAGIKRGVNPNLYTIGVVGVGDWDDALHRNVAELIFDVAQRWNIALDAQHLPTHSEIRASKPAPGTGFSRDKLLEQLGALASRQTALTAGAPAKRFVHLIASANLREGAPRLTARTVRALGDGESIEIIGFTDAGDRVKGNSIWYQTPENNFFWAGNTDKPQPVQETPATPPAPPAQTSLAAVGVRCGIDKIDAIFGGQSSIRIASGETDRQAIGAVQDLLAGQGYRGMPSILSSSYGSFGSATLNAVKGFQTACALPANGEVDSETLKKLVATPAPEPRITQPYLTLVLGKPFEGMSKVVAITAQMEGVGKFGALNLNTDRAGLSFGLIQWAQRPGRLIDVLRAFKNADATKFVEIFGAGSAELADALLRHVSRPNGGVDGKTGVCADPRFNLVEEPWVSRFKLASSQIPFQLAQVDTALRAFADSYRGMQTYAQEIRSERGAAFMLDVANQFGNGGLKRLYQAVRRPGMDERELMQAIADETVEEIQDNFKQGVRARRDGFLHSAFLSDAPVDLLS